MVNINDMEELSSIEKEKIKRWQRITDAKGNGDAYAKAQFNICITLHEKGYVEEALELWHKIQRSDNAAVYAKSQRGIAIILYEKGDVEGALVAWRNIEYSDDIEEYVQAKREISDILYKRGDIEEALEIWHSIRRSDSLEIYSKAQLNIGTALYEKNDIEGAVEAWKNIERLFDSALYARAQIGIGIVLVENNDVNGALIAWKSINEKDDAEIYNQAQYNIGLTLYKKGDKKPALLFLDAVNRADSPDTYAKSRYLASKILKEQNEYQSALKYLCDINNFDDVKIYAQAELLIAYLMKNIGSHIGFLEALHRIKREDHAIHYAFAQWLIGFDFKKTGDTEKAIKIWSGILFSDDSKIYKSAQYKIGQLLICDNESKKYTEARNAFINAESAYTYEAYCYKKICDLLLDVKLEAVGKKAWQLLDKTLEIVEILQLDFGQDSNEEKSPERKLAHYTSTDTANLLLEVNEEKNLPSAFRLNTINNVNDPSEGQLLYNYLKGGKEQSFHAPDFDDKLHAFIGCFTFNHDSLNQFRLYGKQDNKEASGVSLVFQKEFFQSYNSLEGLSFLSLKSEVQSLNNHTVVNKQSIIEKKTDDKISLSKKPVMRCVYLDPTSDYIHLAQRNRLTFFREFGDEKIKISNGNIDIIWADVEWEKYKFELRSKTKDFEKAFKELKVIYKELTKHLADLENFESDILIDISTLANEILLPLKYLIKHSAFQEEQECRIVYITSLDAPEVILQRKKFLFVEYEAKVKENLNKVYIAPAATEYQLYLAWLLRNTNVKIELSNNPYRQT